MNSFSTKRIRTLNEHELNNEGEYVLYWMQINRRVEYNFALEHAVNLANTLNKPLLIYEGLSATYPWASDRFHSYIIDGMKEHKVQSESQHWNYYGYIEPQAKAGKGLVYQLCEKACAIITDDYPVFIIDKHNKRVSKKVDIPFIVVDSTGLIPFSMTEKAPYTAFLFRKILQRNFIDAIKSMPLKSPLGTLKNKSVIEISDSICSKYKPIQSGISSESIIASLDIDHSVKPITEIGTRANALQKFSNFLNNRLSRYQEDRNHPDRFGASRMSGFLHFGKISQHEMVQKVLEYQPEDWDINTLVYENGQSGNFYKGDPAIESFLDELITWREVGHHYAYHVPEYDQYESLPNWVLETLENHSKDKREFIYTLEEFEQSKTHDPIWNAAQRELVKDGRIHNYLRMLWGKKILEWSANPREALQIMIELNNKYAIDGRDPNSYSGIFWVLGRFDRAWGERPIFGKVRYMTSESTAKKVDLKQYLKKWSGLK